MFLSVLIVCTILKTLWHVYVLRGYEYMYVRASICGGQRSLIPWGWLQVVVSSSMWVLGTKCGSSSKVLWFRDLEMAQWLRALAGLPKDPGSILSTHMAAYNCNSSSRGSYTLTQIYIQAKHQYT